MSDNTRRTVAHRYTIVGSLGGGTFRAVDGRRADAEVRLVSAPVDVSLKRMRRRLMRARRHLSWMRHAGVCMPVDFLFDSQAIFAVEVDGRGLPLGRWVQESRPDPESLLQVVIDACDRVRTVHRYGIRLGRMGSANWKMSPEGLLQLCGFHVDWGVLSSGRLVRYAPQEEEGAWSAPDAEADERSDVFCLAVLLSRLMELKRALDVEAIRPFRWPAFVRGVVRRGMRQDRKKRIQTVEQFRGELQTALERLRFFGESPVAEVAPAMRPRFLHRAAAVGLAVVLAACCLLGAIETRGRINALAGTLAWSSVANLAEGQETWVCGYVREASSRMLIDPYLGASVVAYDFSIERELEQRVLDRQTHTYSTRIWREVAKSEQRGVPFNLEENGAEVRVHPQEITQVWNPETLQWRLQAGQSPAGMMGNLAVPLSVKPGQRLLEVTFKHTAIVPGSTMCVFGRVVREQGVLAMRSTPSRPVTMFEGTRASWWAYVIRQLFVPMVQAMVSGAALLVLLWWMRRVVQGETEPVSNEIQS